MSICMYMGVLRWLARLLAPQTNMDGLTWDPLRLLWSRFKVWGLGALEGSMFVLGMVGYNASGLVFRASHYLDLSYILFGDSMVIRSKIISCFW